MPLGPLDLLNQRIPYAQYPKSRKDPVSALERALPRPPLTAHHQQCHTPATHVQPGADTTHYVQPYRPPWTRVSRSVQPDDVSTALSTCAYVWALYMLLSW